MKNILIVYYVPKNTVKFDNWKDGFTSAVDIISDQFNVIKYNLAEDSKSLNERYLEINNIDVVLIKSNWGARVDRFFRSNFPNSSVKKGLLISGSLPPPDEASSNFYDILFYETDWYKQFVQNHKNIVQAFGVNTEVMVPIEGVEKVYDWLTVGKFKSYKRQHLFINKKGRKLAIGEMPTKTGAMFYFSEENRNVRKLKSAGVEVIDFVPYDDLCKIYNQSRSLYIPAKLHGGGERAILEARSCKVQNIEIEQDNPKLKSLLDGPLYSNLDYAKKLTEGINSL